MGLLRVGHGSDVVLPELDVGTQLRILPNHACTTAAQHQAYHVIPIASNAPLMRWARFGGW